MRNAVLPPVARWSGQYVGRAWLQALLEHTAPVALAALKPHLACRPERYAHHVSKGRSVPVPPDGGTRRIVSDQDFGQSCWRHIEKLGGSVIESLDWHAEDVATTWQASRSSSPSLALLLTVAYR